MKGSSGLSSSFVLLSVLSFLLLVSLASSSELSSQQESFLQCLFISSPSISKVVYTPTSNSSNYTSILQARAQDLNRLTPKTPKPIVIIVPTLESHIQTVIICAKKHRLQVRTRSGGHDFESLSFVAQLPFVLIDLFNMRKIGIDVQRKTAWVQTGASNGELYYALGQKSRTLAFPAGICPTVGVGGHISGGGYGFLVRKYGLAADHVIDARLIDANGKILTRKSMSKDLFWAIRGGGGGNFGIVVAWKLELLPVPETVTVFRVNKTREQGGVRLVYLWQKIANTIDNDLTIRIHAFTANKTKGGVTKPTIEAQFSALFVGGVDRLLKVMQKSFPQLGLKREDCIEMRWVEAAVFLAGIPRGTPIEILKVRSPLPKAFFKSKSDYAKDPIPEIGLEQTLNRFFEMEIGTAELRLTPYGGKMREIPTNSTPFAYRSRLYQIQYLLVWRTPGTETYQKHITWIRRLYAFAGRFFPNNPRAAYVNYRDLDLGTNNIVGNTSYEKASIWGRKYYDQSFRPLAQVKTQIDPSNFFRDEQSIPIISGGEKIISMVSSGGKTLPAYETH